MLVIAAEQSPALRDYQVSFQALEAVDVASTSAASLLTVAKPNDTKAVLLASRALVAIAAKSLAQVEDLVSAMQWRVMVVVSRQGELALHELATALGVHPSTGTRLCDQLVAKGFLSRHDHPVDRRYLVLSLTPAGKGLVDQVTQERQRDIEIILGRLLPATRKQLIKALTDFAEAAGELTVDPLWDLVESPASTSGG